MKQEDINEVLTNHASPEANINWLESVREANERGCACADSPSGHNTLCLWSGHTMQQKETK